MRAHEPVESYSVKLRKGMYIDLFLHSSDEPEKGSFIKMTLYKNGKRSSVFLKKDKASFLCMQLQFMIQKGLELDMEELKKKYPEQKTWHIK
ncbi:MAG: hypothetical protein OEY88_04635 [Candidatus Bathyarchaeota archaeon]|nr:hypothetical protein [Candidatus Bathyarchaeota archaeon]